jgi:hypothetical protein
LPPPLVLELVEGAAAVLLVELSDEVEDEADGLELDEPLSTFEFGLAPDFGGVPVLPGCVVDVPDDGLVVVADDESDDLPVEVCA